MLKGNISDVYSHKYMKINFSSYDDFLLNETINMHNVVILIKIFLVKIIIVTTIMRFQKNVHLSNMKMLYKFYKFLMVLVC